MCVHDSELHSYRPLQLVGGNGKVFAAVAKLVEERADEQLVDFDMHLDDPSQDWLNTSLKSVFAKAGL